MRVRLVVVKGYEIPTDSEGRPYRPGSPAIMIWPADQPIPPNWIELEIAEPEAFDAGIVLAKHEKIQSGSGDETLAE